MIFTDPQATVAALKTAGSLARDLGACIRVRAAIAVPYALPLDRPPVSADFIEELLSDLVCRLDLDAFEPSVHLYQCRDQVETLLHVLSPNSLVVIGGRKHWWPTAERRVAKALRSKGHRVVFIGLKPGTKSGSSMKSKTPIRPATQTMEGILPRNVNDDLPISSAIVGVTLLGDLEDVLAVLRTAVLLARSLKAPLSLNLIGKDILSGDVDETPYSTWCRSSWIPQERNFEGLTPRRSPWKLTSSPRLLLVPGPLRCAFTARIRFWGVSTRDKERRCARNVLHMYYVPTMPLCDVARSRGEVNHVGSFLCRCCDCLFRSDVGIYQGVGSPVGGFDGIRDCRNCRGMFCSFT